MRALRLLGAGEVIVHAPQAGAGKRLFEDRYAKTKLRLRETRPFASRAVVLYYEPDHSA